MSVSEILPGFFFIQRGFLNGNHFAFKSEHPILIDTGYISDFDKTAFLLDSIGINPANTGLIINTHCHCDHVGGNRLIQDMSGCKIAMHRIGKHFMDIQDSWSTWWRYYIQDADFFKCETALEDGAILAVGPYQFEVIYTPGHASDGIVLYNPENRILISSDTLWEYDMAVMTVRVEGSRALFCMDESLDRISRLEVDIVYPGHGKEFTDFEAAIQRAKTRLKRFMSDPSSVGLDLIKKIVVYTLMMRGSFISHRFLDYLMTTPWYTETVNLYFQGEFEKTYNMVMTELIDREIVFEADDCLFTNVTP